MASPPVGKLGIDPLNLTEQKMDSGLLLVGGLVALIVVGGAFALIYWLLGRGSDDDSKS